MSLLSIESEDTGSWCVVLVATVTVSEAAVAFSWITFSGFGHFQMAFVDSCCFQQNEGLSPYTLYLGHGAELCPPALSLY